MGLKNMQSERRKRERVMSNVRATEILLCEKYSM